MRRSRLRAAALAAPLGLLLMFWQGTALADGDPVGDLVSNVQSQLSGSPSTTHSVPNTPTDDEDSAGHETENPKEPNHAKGGIAQASLAGNDLLTVGSTSSNIKKNDSSSGDVTVLAIGGTEVVGAHSSSSGPKNAHQDPLAPLCSGSGGGVCVALLFADTSSNNGKTKSSSTSDTELAGLCLGGSAVDLLGPCTGPIGAGVSSSHSEIHRNKFTGKTTADQETDLANVCVGPTGIVLGTCSGVGVTALHSESHSTAPSEHGKGTTTHSSYLLGLSVQGVGQQIISDPTGLAIPPGCPVGGSLLCLFLNQGEGFVYVGGGASAQEGIHLSVLPGVVMGADLALGHLGTAETLAENNGPSVKECPDGSIVAIDAACPSGGGGNGPNELAFTGSSPLIPVAVALNLIALGALMLAWDRRRMAVAA